MLLKEKRSVGVRKLDKDKVLKALNCCANFVCGECPYNYLESKDYPLRCIHIFLQDLKIVVDELLKKEGEKRNGDKR